ncbi:MAG: hypothetical protein SYR96_13455 [Actinomycetota bacterium]|nr:hypothetical protein [Actinomycetota bacterium]
MAAKRSRAHDDPELFAAYKALVTEDSAAAIDHVADLVRQLEVILTDGMAGGSFRRADPSETARAVFTATTHFHHRAWPAPGRTRGIAHELDVVCGLLLDGLR